MNLEKWASNLVSDVHNQWKSLQEKHGCFSSGYSVFYSPVSSNPALMVIGFNPGGGADSFDETKANQIPQEHDYFVHDYALAKKMRDLFSSIGKSDLLKNSVKTNLIFFRTKSQDDWNAVEPVVRKQIEMYCRDKVLEMIEVMKPRLILSEGIETYLTLKRALGIQEDEALESQGRSLFLKAKSSSLKLLGIIHPSGARVSNDDWSLIRSRLLVELP
jgi:hypothetical protein